MKLSEDGRKVIIDSFKSIGVAWLVAGTIIPVLRPVPEQPYITVAIPSFLIGLGFIFIAVIVAERMLRDDGS